MWVIDYFKSSLLNKYMDFSGRARRKEMGSWILVSFVLAFVLGIIDGITGLPILGGLFSLATFIPQLSLSVRRIHDLGYSGWYILINFLVGLASAIMIIVGAILASKHNDGAIIFIAFGGLLLLACLAFQLALIFMKGNDGSNKYGEDPKLDGVP